MRIRLLLAGMLGAVITAAGCTTTSGTSGIPPRPPAAPSPSATTTIPRPSAVPPSPTAPGPALAPPARPARPPATLLELGGSGPAVIALQTRLSRLGYWLGRADGTFGLTTQQAVYALQKAAGLTADGVYGPKTAAALTSGTLPRARSSSGHVIEISLTPDLLLIVNGGKVSAVLNTSTGGGYTYTTGGVTAVARTPAGQFRIFRSVDGMDISPLGQLWRPRYFYGGYAIHGSDSIPPYPVSHGCVRLSYPAIDWIWATGQAPIGTEVLVYY
jgi:peptidoglycan hydrolase-like protein with peptidoglycan-binding domain